MRPIPPFWEQCTGSHVRVMGLPDDPVAKPHPMEHGREFGIAMSLDAINDAEHRTGYQFSEIVDIIKKRWPKPKEGWRGMSDIKKFALHRVLVNQSWLSDAERQKLIELNDRLCTAPGNPADAGDEAFMNAMLRRAKREGVRI